MVVGGEGLSAASTVPLPSPHHHELVDVFADAGLPLCRSLTEMFDECPEHRSERRGCGYTQATRWMADVIHAAEPGAGAARVMFDRSCCGDGDDILHAAALRLRTLLDERLERFESRLIARLMLACVLRDGVAPVLASGSTEKLAIGTCPLAEEFFLEIAHGRVRRGGSVNVVVGFDGTPMLIEKCGLGESHSCISVAPLCINGVDLPIGSLIGIERDEQLVAACGPTRSGRGAILPPAAVHRLRFLRLTTLSVPPDVRARAFSSHFEQQVRGRLFSPDRTTIAQLADVAARECA